MAKATPLDFTSPYHARKARHWIFSYDVSNNRRRRRLASLMEGQAMRIQRSVFTTTCSQHEVVALLHRAAALIEEDDRMVAWPVINHSGLPALWKQRQKKLALPDYWVV